MLHNILKILTFLNQKSLSKLFMTSQQIFTWSKSTREALQVYFVLMSLFFTIDGFKQKNVYLDSLNWLWNYIHLHKFTSYGMLLLECYMRNNLACLVGYPTHLDVSDISNLFYFHFVFTWSRAMTRLLTEIQFTSLARWLCECLCTNLNYQRVKLVFIAWLWVCV